MGHLILYAATELLPIIGGFESLLNPKLQNMPDAINQNLGSDVGSGKHSRNGGNGKAIF
jgi:hypothetical protein